MPILSSVRVKPDQTVDWRNTELITNVTRIEISRIGEYDKFHRLLSQAIHMDRKKAQQDLIDTLDSRVLHCK